MSMREVRTVGLMNSNHPMSMLEVAQRLRSNQPMSMQVEGELLMTSLPMLTLVKGEPLMTSLPKSLWLAVAVEPGSCGLVDH
jgi:hypothetical protein